MRDRYDAFTDEELRAINNALLFTIGEFMSKREFLPDADEVLGLLWPLAKQIAAHERGRLLSHATGREPMLGGDKR